MGKLQLFAGSTNFFSLFQLLQRCIKCRNRDCLAFYLFLLDWLLTTADEIRSRLLRLDFWAVYRLMAGFHTRLKRIQDKLFNLFGVLLNLLDKIVSLSSIDCLIGPFQNDFAERIGNRQGECQRSFWNGLKRGVSFWFQDGTGVLSPGLPLIRCNSLRSSFHELQNRTLNSNLPNKAIRNSAQIISITVSILQFFESISR